jgi:hypothetical protein
MQVPAVHGRGLLVPMPRRRRPEEIPKVLIPKDSLTQAEMREKLGPLPAGEEPALRRRLKYVTKGLVTIEAQQITELFDCARQSGIQFDEGLAWRLTRLVQWPLTRLCKRNGQPIEENGGRWYYLDETGCRIRFKSQSDLASQLHVSSSHLKHTVRQLRDLGFIVAGGKGWLEFNARLVWKGDYKLRDIYIQFQRDNIPSLRPFEFVDDQL